MRYQTTETLSEVLPYSNADVSQSSSGTSVSIGDRSPKPSAILSHRMYIADGYTSILGISPMCRLCVCDILNLGIPYRMFADCCASAWRKISVYALIFSLCRDAFVKD